MHKYLDIKGAGMVEALENGYRVTVYDSYGGCVTVEGNTIDSVLDSLLWRLAVLGDGERYNGAACATTKWRGDVPSDECTQYHYLTYRGGVIVYRQCGHHLAGCYYSDALDYGHTMAKLARVIDGECGTVDELRKTLIKRAREYLINQATA